MEVVDMAEVMDTETGGVVEVVVSIGGTLIGIP